MTTSSESHEELRSPPTANPVAPSEVTPALVDPGLSPDQIRSLHEAAERDLLPVEPTPREIEDGALEAFALFQEYTGTDLPDEPLDEETQRLLYALHKQREGWTSTLESDARATLQLLYPDVGGSSVHGPL